MIKTVLVASSFVLASPVLLASSAAAAPNWTSIGKGNLPRYGSGNLYIGKLARQRNDVVSGELRAVLDEPWINPDASGSYSDIYFRVRANCREGTLAVQPTYPESPQDPTIEDKDMRAPPPGSPSAALLRAYCQ
jgi:hypothetical protein